MNYAFSEYDKQSEEWEAVEMNIFEIGVERGKELGIEQGSFRTMIRHVELNMKNLHLTLEEACKGLEISVEDYENAKQQIAQWKEEYGRVQEEFI